ncbi:MAG TPA: DUF3090 domain-containing protein [Acidimicrobiales bacterium]|nr:DUF3090 domain-containing protein [Acidimicrobiales bacterium]
MSTSFEMPEVDALTTGAIGSPGRRVFYLQARQGDHVVSLRLEKTQVAALVTYLEALLADLPSADELPSDLELVEPVVAEWVVGSLGVSYDEEADRIVLLAEELVEEGEDAASARITATRAQIAALAAYGADVVAAGRPPCPLCGQPLDPEGHMCVRLNGHRQIR